jgi:hypothetical protein
MANLPTADEMLDNAARELDNARNALSEVRDWLNSSWRPVGSSLTDAQADRRRRMSKAASEAKAIIDRSDRWVR